MKANDVLDHLKDVREVTAKVIDREPATKIVVTPEMVTMRPGKGKRLLEVEKDGVKDLFQFLHMPPDMVGKIMPSTCGQVANDLLGHKERFELLMKDGKIIGFRAPHVGHSMSPERVLESIEKVVEEPDYHKVAIDGQNVNLEIVGIDKETVTRGDVVRAGALVKFSPLGISNPSVQSFVLRLVCTNGMTSSTVLREYSFGGGGRGGGDDGDRLLGNTLQMGVRRKRQRVAHGLQPFVHVGILKNGTLMRALGLAGGDEEVVDAMARLRAGHAVVEHLPLEGQHHVAHKALHAAPEQIGHGDG